ncbi:UNVERIFIED_CONTAM: hypothetical protein FKN15_032975 [Acipenser sinensis]
MIKKIQNDAGVRIQFKPDDGTGPDKVAHIMGPPERCEHAASIINELLQSIRNVKAINQETGAFVEISRQPPPNGDPNFKLFIIRGSPQQIDHAKQLIEEKIEAPLCPVGPGLGGPGPSGPMGPYNPGPYNQGPPGAPPQCTNGALFGRKAAVYSDEPAVLLHQERCPGEQTVLQMLKLDPLDKTLHVPFKQLDISLATKQALDKASQKLQANAPRGQEFKMECITIIATTSKKLLERSPLMYPAVRLQSSLDPVAMVTEEKSSVIKIEKLSQLLLNAKWCTAPQCDHFLSQMIQHKKAEFLDFVHKVIPAGLMNSLGDL